MAAVKGFTFSVDEVQSFLQQLDADDVALDAKALVAIAGGSRSAAPRCRTIGSSGVVSSDGSG